MRAVIRSLMSCFLVGVVLLLPGAAPAQADAPAPINYRHVATIGGAGNWGCNLAAPYDVAVGDGGFIYVTDLGPCSLIKISPEFYFVAATQAKVAPNTVAVAGAKVTLQAPTGVSCHGGRVYVTDGDDVVAYNQSDLVFLRRFASVSDQMGWGRGLEVVTGFFSPPAMYVADIGLHRAYRYDLSDPSSGVVLAELAGAEVKHWGTYGRGGGEFRAPCAVACVPDGTGVYVLDRDNHRVQRFSVDGQLSSAWGAQGSGPMQFRRPEGIAVGPDGSVYVADTDNHRIQRFSADGAFIQQWGERGEPSDPMGLRAPRGITVDAQGRVYVCDTDNGVVKVYGPRLLIQRPLTIQQRP